MMTTVPPLSTWTIRISSLSCKSSGASCSPFESCEYFGGFIRTIFILILFFEASMNV